MVLDELFVLIPLGLLRGAVFAFGLLWGSFLNVVIYRVPRELSVVRPASHCPGCGEPIAPYDNIPVLSYVLLRGRARCCGVRMSPRYPVVELIGGALSLAVFEVFVLGLPGSTSVGRAAAIYGADFALCMGLVAAAFIDAEHMFLPDPITIGGIVLGVFTATLRGLPFTDSLIGAAAGFVGVWLPFIFLYKGLLGRTGMGLGDAKLLALAGAWFGWPGAVFTLFAGAVQGTLYTVVTRVLGIEPKLPDAVLEEIAELEKAAAAGDEEAKKALAEDPLTEDENNPFIVRFFQRLFGLRREEGGEPVEAPAAPSAGGETSEDASSADDATAKPPQISEDASSADDATAEAEPPRARIPFGPFLILAMLELLFAGDWLRSHLLPALWPEL
jgi:leader peptidase (prepilin peptidase)/N-methyltransferase